ncbi:heterokaryon incompatibility protein-domain-containing protein [Annulohypoxylon maeteangense]|uniref:heterokaryon incompatibility protein-domain-containing protein n=1 Tax=Annulohypoxylon maeteangense TaxID=1927788 RepID=UPI002008065B|nr:heterokaryon incompatibility protein-domain-containing protein [Annulohypoxylon maeteangense]KAI0889556.1 heterokaryon incompatibility protein-domain-containing protein [Annulohypoxylon maeteangense]
MPSIYHLLPEGATRLLTLHPLQPDGRIRCSFGVYNVNDAATTPSYVALSYVWGPETPTFEIIVDNEVMTIRENLYAFLLQCISDSLLWIDALCINQQDNRERNQQVQLMGNIYKRAQMVWAWLGPARDPKLRSSLIRLRENSSEYFDIIERSRKDQCGPYLFDELETLSRCDYWERAWVVQEFLLAKQVVLVYGDVQIDAELIGSLIYYQERNSKLLARKRRYEIEGRTRDLFDPGSDSDSDIFGSSLANHGSLMHSMCTQRDNYLPQADVSEEPAIIWLLRNNYRRMCREPRDIIYCLLSLAFPDHDGQKYGINVDYDEDIAAVFCSVMDGVTLESDAIFAYATVLKRILRLDVELPIQIRSIGNREEKYIKVRGFIDGEVVEVLSLDDQIAEDERSRVNLDNMSPSVVAWLKEYDSPFSSKRKDMFEWEEEWLIASKYQDDHLVDNSTQQKVTFISPGDNDRNLEDMSLLHQLSTLENLQLKRLDEISRLIPAFNLRSFSPDQHNPNPPNVIDVDPPRTALVIMRFRTKVSSKQEEYNIETHYFKADYVLGLSRGNVSVGDKIFKFPYSLPGVALSLYNQPGRQLTGVMAYGCDGKHFGGSHPVGDRDEFPSYGEMASVYRPDYLYGKISVKMKAEEILQLTS